MSTTTTAPHTIDTLNPATGKTLATYPEHDRSAIDTALGQAVATYRTWRTTPIAERAKLVSAAAGILRARKAELGLLATREMGKTVVEAEAEVEKSAVGCDYYANHGHEHLADIAATSNAAESYIAFRPLGVLLAIMPWNFPYWQVFRAAAPALVAGNTVVLKHAANVTGCALEIERVFEAAGFPKGAFTALVVSGKNMEAIVADPRIAAVTLAGKYLKKTVLELGGSDAYIVLADADVEAAAKMAVRARFQNNGQSCIAAKRFIVEDAVYDAFAAAFVTHTEALKAGDPEDRATTLGPVAREDLRDALHEQVQKTIAAGGKLLTGGKPLDRAGSYYAATIVGDVKPGMVMFDEETFGPAAALTRARDAEHAIELANDSPYGLGGNLWTRDIARGKEIAKRLESGAVFINGMTASDPRLPFGGVKRSGYGRELSGFGIHEFVNIQTVWIGPAKDAATNTTPSE
jgi:succinate-semialdehyde dehydrogenase/glutarate-semialdehyde dehydrogenase